MKLSHIIRGLSMLAYFSIILKGMIIGIPFILFLFFTLFEWGTKTQVAVLFAFIGLISLVALRKRPKTTRTLLIEIIVFILLLLPILERITSVPISLFNYAAFIIPAISFIILYPLSLLFSYREINRDKRI
jgi:hypothetical protein